jgi:(p)ppGpp synthase/HD superfamily hydrolase
MQPTNPSPINLHSREDAAQSLYNVAIYFAAAKHRQNNQKIPGTDLPYVVHLSNVAMEILMAAPHSHPFNLGLAIQVALLHYMLEDTGTTSAELEAVFGTAVADGVQALTKDKSLPKHQRMSDCLQRIKNLPKEIWAVKLADRITNLQPPPNTWDNDKKKKYLVEAKLIHQALKDGNAYLADRILSKIDGFQRYIDDTGA